MKFLHTSDWHLGKTLEGYPRLNEQEQFLNELCAIADDTRADMVIVAGDVYDSVNPPAAAEKLFYKYIERLACGGRRPVLVIAGNHDNPDRLTAVSPLAYERGVILLGTPLTAAETGDYGHYAISDAGEGFVEIRLNNERAVIAALPYPSEKRLNEILYKSFDDDMQNSYAEKLSELYRGLSARFKEDTVNVAAGHFYVSGGETADSERDISVGGVYAAPAGMFDGGASYIAMGHLHKSQTLGEKVHYSGSPIQLSKTENTHAKCVLLADVPKGKNAGATVERVFLRCHKPMEVWRCDGYGDALDKCLADGQEAWVYLEIATDRPLSQGEIHKLRLSRKDIVEITPILPVNAAGQAPELTAERGVFEEFVRFYESERGVAPGEDLKKLFLTISEADDEAG